MRPSPPTLTSNSVPDSHAPPVLRAQCNRLSLEDPIVPETCNTTLVPELFEGLPLKPPITVTSLLALYFCRPVDGRI